MKAMILAAGLGTRLRPITEHFAKPAVPFLNVPLLYYSLSLIEKTEAVTGLVINTHHLPAQISALVSNIAPSSPFNITLSPELEAPLGSGGGIRNARELLEGGENFLVANGDEVILPHNPKVMSEFVSRHVVSQALATLLVMKHPLVGTQFGGVWATPSGRVKGFGKDGSHFGADVTGYHYIGLLLLNERIFRYLPDGESNILYDGLAKGIALGEKVQVVVDSFTWYETGNPTDYLKATGAALDLVANGKGEDAQLLRQICSRYCSPGSRFVNNNGIKALIGGRSEVSESAVFKGFAVVSDGASVGKSSLVQNAVVLPGSRLEDEREISNEILI